MEKGKKNPFRVVKFPVIELSAEGHLYYVLASFAENLMIRRKTSTELFQDNYGGDPSGSQYWRGWFDLPVLDVVSFAKLLAVHKATEYDDSHATGKGLSVRLDEKVDGFHVSKTRGPMLLTKHAPKQDEVLRALRGAAKGEVSFFRGDCTLLANMTDTEIARGWKVERAGAGEQRALTKVNLNPREALEWFIATSLYTDLLPESLRAWATKSKQAATENTAASHPIQKKLRSYQKHRMACREIAKVLWKQDPTITITSMSDRDEIHTLLKGKSYSDDTFRGWFKDLCPNRNPGRRKKNE